MFTIETYMWLGFSVLLIGLLAIDLLVLNKGEHVITAKTALIQWAMWIGEALIANVGIYYLYLQWYLPHRGPTLDPKLPSTAGQAALMFLQPYLIEQTLSMDNMLVIALLMQYFLVPAKYQHRVLFWGIVGVVILRGIMIMAGIELVQRFAWMHYVFGALLLFTALKMLMSGEDESPDLDKNFVVRMCKKVLPFTNKFDGSRFLTRENGKLLATPLLLALIVVDFADAIFAIDSIPATVSFTQDKFLAFTANCFAVLGLRALYFGVAALIERFVYMKTCLILLLAFIGMKMIFAKWIEEWAKSKGFEHLELWSLGVVLLTLAAGVIVSLMFPPSKVEDPDMR